MAEIIEVQYCNSCKRWTKHSLLFDYTFENTVADTIYYTNTKIWYCRGSEDVLYQTTFSSTDDTDESGNLILHKFFFPDRSFKQISSKVFLTLPHNLNLLYNEIVIAINQYGLILASMGLRALLEGICKDKGVTGNNLEKIIDNMNFVNEKVKANLHGIRFMGNDAAHDLNSLSREEILIALEIMEDLMNYTYELDYKSSRILEIMNQRHLNKGVPSIPIEQED